MKIQNISINKIKPYENNPRVISDDAVEKVMASIKEFGFQQPIVVDKDMVIIVGHTRLKASKKLGLKEVPVVVADNLTDEQARAYRLADNKTNEFSKWADDLLTFELQELECLNFDMAQFGFEAMFEEEPEIVEDEFDGEPVEVAVQLGDIYQLGNHRLMCGDSTDKECVARLMDGNKADMVFTDPPYGYKYQSNYQDKYEMLVNDDKILDYISATYEHIKDNVGIYSFCGWQSLEKWLEYFSTTNLSLKNIVIWKKNNWSMGDLKGAYAGQYEVIIYLNKGRTELKGGRDTDVWEFDREPPKHHPTMKPLNLIAYALKKSSEKEDIVLDCFGGSGSTLIACEQLNRKCFMMELDPYYCQVIIDRWEAFTGNKAVKVS